jgi:Asp-tRNA(Asn)/Glu-tRNA(Gln) amidotransferase A subunit family amidase
VKLGKSGVDGAVAAASSSTSQARRARTAQSGCWPGRGVASAPGLPATVAPIGSSEEGLPIGLQIIGPMFEDRTTIRFVELIEREFGGFVPPPLA